MSKVKLNEVTTIIMGQSPSSDSYNEVGDGLPFYQGKSDFGKLNPTARIYCNQPKKSAEEHDILMSVRAPVGDVNIADTNCCIGRGLCAIRANEQVNYKYIYYYLKTIKYKLELMSTGSTFKAINKSVLDSIELNIPSLKEQERIVSILEKAENAIDKREESIKLLDELVKSRFIEMFGNPVTNPKGWEKASIGSKFEIKTGATPSRKENTYWKNGNIPWVKTTELKEVVINETEEYITTEGYNNSSVNLLPKDTVLIAMYGQGKTRGMTGKLGIEATTNQACASILPNSEENMDFIWYQLKLSYEDLRNLGRGGSQPNLNTNLIKSYELIFPPMELQDRFVEFIKQVDKLKFEMDNSLKELENNFKSLMQKAFNGEL